jgi:hypothetical protein
VETESQTEAKLSRAVPSIALFSLSSTAWPGNGLLTPRKKGKIEKTCKPVAGFLFLETPKKLKKKMLRLFLTSHSCSVTSFTFGFRLFFILLKINLLAETRFAKEFHLGFHNNRVATATGDSFRVSFLPQSHQRPQTRASGSSVNNSYSGQSVVVLDADLRTTMFMILSSFIFYYPLSISYGRRNILVPGGHGPTQTKEKYRKKEF